MTQECFANDSGTQCCGCGLRHGPEYPNEPSVKRRSIDGRLYCNDCWAKQVRGGPTLDPTLKALIEKWRECRDVYGRLAVDEAMRQCALGLERSLQAHPVVPLAELVALRDGSAGAFRTLEGLIAKYTPQPPNPHPQGTYLWAREENQRERTVFRRGDPALTRVDGKMFWMDLRFKHADFTATDWEVVT